MLVDTTVGVDEVAGLPCYWVDSGRNTLSASLIFRVGMVDETLPTTGWLHLVEHLALHGREKGALHVNGSTSLLTTQFDFHGPREAVLECLSDVITWLTDPDVSRLPAEARVLRAESEYRGSGDSALALLQRYGARGPGLAGYSEPGLTRADEHGLRDIVARLFVAANGVLALDGAPPATLPVLPTGHRLALPQRPSGESSDPAAYITQGRLVLSGEVPRTLPAMFVPHVLQDMLRRDLREKAQGAYAPWGSYEAVDADVAIAFCGSDIAASLMPDVVHHVTSGLDALGRNGPIEGVVEDAVASASQSLRDPMQAPGMAWRAALRDLAGHPPQTPAQYAEELAAVTRADVAALIPGFADSLLLGVPGQATWRDEFPMLSLPSVRGRPSGSRHRSRGFPQDRSVLAIDGEHLQVASDGVVQRIAFAEVAGIFANEDGRRRVVDHAGWGITVEPTLWRNGTRAVELLDSRVPPELRMHFPRRDDDTIPRPPTVPVRWLAWLRAEKVLIGRIAWVLVCMVIAGVGIALGRLLPLVTGVVFGGLIVRDIVKQRRAARE